MIQKLWKTFLLHTFIVGMLIIAYPALAECHDERPDFIPNPIQVCSFTDLVIAVTDQITSIGIVLSVVAIIIIGFKLIVASVSANAGDIASAQKMLWWVLIGTAIVVGSSAIAHAVINFAKQLGTT